VARSRRVQHGRELLFYDTRGECPNPGLRNDHEIAAEAMTIGMPSKHLADPPLQAVSDHRASSLATHSDSEAGRPVAIAYEKHEARGSPLVTTAERQELPTATKPRRLGEALALSGRHRGCFGGMETVSRLRPFARLRLRTLRPPGVAMRARNPWVRLRRVLLG
jgi:hypothetical protein